MKALVAADGTPIGWPSPEIPLDVARIAQALPTPNRSEAAELLRREACRMLRLVAPADRDYYATVFAHMIVIADCLEAKRPWRRGPANWERATAINVLAAAAKHLRPGGWTLEQTALALAQRNAAALSYDGPDGVETLRRAILDAT